MNILEPNFNGLPPVTDWEKVFIALQQANEKVFRGASAKEFGKQVIGDIAIQGADFEDLPIATSSDPVVLPIPETEMKFGFLANGTYTQSNGPDLEYSTTQWGLTLFDGIRWIKKFTLELPDNSANSADWIAGLYFKNDIRTHLNKQWIALQNTSQEPSENSKEWKLIDESSKSFKKEKTESIKPATIVNGFLTRTGTSNNNTEFKRTATANVNMFNITEGKAYTYDGEIDLAVYSRMAGILYFDETFNLLMYDASETKVFKDYNLNYPEGTKYIGACSKGIAPVIKEVDERLVLKSSALPKDIRGSITITVDPDAELSENVFHNMADAIARYKEFDSAIIRAKGTIYRETINLDTIGDIRIESMDNNQIIISGGEILTGWSKTTGYNNIYQIPYSKTIPTTTQDSRRRLFENGRESVEIPPEKYHVLQKGLKNVMPYTEIKEVFTVADCEIVPGTFFYSGGILYMHTNDSSSPFNTGYTYENSVRPNTTWGGTRTGRKIELNNITFMFSNNDGCHIYGRHIVRNNVYVFGSASEGINDDNCTGYSINDEVGGAGADCINGHNVGYDALNIRYGQYLFCYYNVYVHDSDGDCISHHARSMIYIQNILGERCKRRGAIPYGGCTMTINIGKFRDNHLEGCMAQNNTEDNNGGKVSTILHLINVVSEGHTTNFRTTEGAIIIAEWTRSKAAFLNDVDNAGTFIYSDFGVDHVGTHNIVGSGLVIRNNYTII
ncbi:hypothetical protein [Sphingobacterium sp. MYb388]|uniref:hypothetical protein n=1 Tax=Sphingobacterium sp. MYb388 TaxID=2745437 RepID=UPI0030954514